MSHDPRTDHRLPAARRLPMLALPAALLACASPALAADANTADATTLDTIQVTAPIMKDTGTATKTDTPLVEVPQSISIITARDLQDRGLHAVAKAMWYVAGAPGGVYGMDTRSEERSGGTGGVRTGKS